MGNVAFEPVADEHELLESPDFQESNDVRKRRQRQCKVCSFLKTSASERQGSKIYCGACSVSTARFVVYFAVYFGVMM